MGSGLLDLPLPNWTKNYFLLTHSSNVPDISIVKMTEYVSKAVNHMLINVPFSVVALPQSAPSLSLYVS